jgi:hypothetical protein
VYVGRFRGYRTVAFGKVQILDYTAEIEVYQARQDPPAWMARETTPGSVGGYFSPRAEDTMRLVREAFVTCVEPWQRYEIEAFGKKVKLGPRLVEKPAKTA